jgi:dihydrofolate reductase
MIISLIVAVSRNGVIGHQGTLPWHLPADLRHFKQMTWGKPLLMGRVTHQSIGRPLPGRQNIVLSRDPSYHAAGCSVVTSLQQGVEAAGEAPELMIIGGAELYRQALPLAQRIELTEVDVTLPGDRFFPALDPGAWREVWRCEQYADERNPYAYRFIRLERCETPTASPPSSSSMTSTGPSPARA